MPLGGCPTTGLLDWEGSTFFPITLPLLPQKRSLFSTLLPIVSHSFALCEL
jgi:hypothetical protein